MYIHRVVLRGLKTSPDRDLVFWNDWREEPLRKVLIVGHNGTGKTTFLKVVVALWENLGAWLRFGKTPTGTLLDEVGIAAIELGDFIADKKVWLFVAQDSASREYLNEISDLSNTLFIGETRNINGKSVLEPLSPADWFQTLAHQYEQLLLGLDRNLLPNLLYLDADERKIYPPQINDTPSAYYEPLYQWLVTYQASPRWEGHLEAMFRNLKVRDPQWFATTVANINRFLAPAKKIADFDNYLRLQVLVGEENFHYLEALSAGEQQYVLMMFMVSRWQMVGGIVLIDEPDLHVHVSVERFLIHELQKLVKERNGQLIITSHSEQTSEEYNYHERINFGVPVIES